MASTRRGPPARARQTLTLSELGWPSDAAGARALQAQLASRVVAAGSASHANLVAGVDVHVRNETAIAVAALVHVPTLDLRETATAEEPVRFPYLTGLLAFRELPAALAAVERLRTPPQAVLVDGHGLAHPRRFGLACHLGLTLDLPTAGCAKTRLVGDYPMPDGPRGSLAALTHRGEVVGAVLRTRADISPVFVSVGHRLSLQAATALVLRCTGRFRQPEPLRQAHLAARALARA
ncbi:MAG: endonuclease V [Chloroflexi bacterium]|nr:endonuclease V [Chloroflexota bacterium]